MFTFWLVLLQRNDLIWSLFQLIFLVCFDFFLGIFLIEQNKKFFSRNLRENTFWLPRKKNLFSLFSIAGAFRCGVVLSFCTNYPRLRLWTFTKLLLHFSSHNLSTPPMSAPKTSDMFRMKWLRQFSSAELGPITSVVFVFSSTIRWFTFHRLIFLFLSRHSHAENLYFSHILQLCDIRKPFVPFMLLFLVLFLTTLAIFYDLNDDSIAAATFWKALREDERKISAD